MRSFDELLTASTNAIHNNDTDTLEQCAIEFDMLGTTEALEQASVTRRTMESLRGNYQQSLAHYNRALEYFENRGYRTGVASVIGNIGNIYTATANYPQALEYYSRSLAMCEELGDKGRIAHSTGNIGAVYQATGNYPQALEYFHKALELHIESGNNNGTAVVTGNIGIIYFGTGNYTSALEYFHNALRLHEEVGDRYGAIRVIGNIGTANLALGNNSIALEFYDRALNLYRELDNRNGVVRLTVNIIHALFKTNSFAEAEELLRSIEGIHIDEPEIAIEREEGRAIIQQHHGLLDDAVRTLESALESAKAFTLLSAQATIHGHLRDIHQQRNDFAAYIEHNNEHTRINSEIDGKDTAAKLAMQEAERRVAKERESIAKEREREQEILYSTLPKHIAERVIRGERVNDHIDDASVIFLDIVGFTTLSSALTSQQVATLLDTVFAICDDSCSDNNVTRVKTIGDSYLAFCDIDH